MNITELREKATNIKNNTTYGNDFWSQKRQELLHEIQTNDINNFLRWPVMTETMYVANASYSAKELESVKDTQYNLQVKASPVGNPIPPTVNPESCSNLIHNLYHLCTFEKFSNKSIQSFNTVIEFGGGYGCVSKIIKENNKNCNYYIFDFPEFNLIQQYYHEQHGIYDVKYISNIDDLQSIKYDLLIATWSLSESPLSLRNDFLNKIDVSNFLLAYQESFEGTNNNDFFLSMVNEFEENKWTNAKITFLPPTQYYLLGY